MSMHTEARLGRERPNFRILVPLSFLTSVTLLLGGCATDLSGSAVPPSAYANATSSRQYSYAPELRESHREATVLDTVLVNAIAQIGKPYVWGGESRSEGFDCSGLIQYVLSQAGVEVPRTAAAQAAALPAVPMSRIQKGDLLFFNTLGRPYSHVGIYIGGDQFVSALNRRAGITVQSLRNPYWSSRLDGIRRPMPPELLAMTARDSHVLNR
ncbi:MAG: C40 family peptidase [Acidithiobacillus sp.]